MTSSGVILPTVDHLLGLFTIILPDCSTFNPLRDKRLRNDDRSLQLPFAWLLHTSSSYRAFPKPSQLAATICPSDDIETITLPLIETRFKIRLYEITVAASPTLATHGT